MRKLVTLIALLLAFAVPAFAQKGPESELGFQPGKLYDFSEIDSVNLFNGNLMITVPIGPRKQVSSTLSYQIQAIYNGKVWDFESWECNEESPGADDVCEESIPNRRSNAGMGWRISFGRLLPPFSPSVHKKNSTDTRSAWVYEGPTGDEHPFYAQAGNTDVQLAMDASALRLVKRIEEGITYYDVEFPSGEVHRFELEQGAWRLRQISDRFAGFIKFTYEYDNERRVLGQHIFDSTLTGHTIHYQIETALHEGVDRGSVVDYIEYTGAGGKVVRYDFKYDPVSVRQFRHNESNRITLPMLMWIEQPDLTRYSFNYFSDPDTTSNDQDEAGAGGGALGSITVPTGGKSFYHYRFYSAPAKKPCNGMTPGEAGISKRIISDGNPLTARTWQYFPSINPGAPVEFTDKNADYCCTGSAPSGASPRYWLRTSVLSPMDKPFGSDTGPRVRTDHYFDAWSFEYEFPAGCPSTVPEGPVLPVDPWAFEGRGAFGYPGTMAAPPKSVRQNKAEICNPYGECPPDEKTIDNDGRRLTTEVYINCAADGDCSNGTLARSTWTSYEPHPLSEPGSPYPFAGDNDISFQLKSSKTFFHDDNGCTGGDCWVATDNFDDNGAGLHERVVQSSNFPNAKTKTTTTNYDQWTKTKAFTKDSVWITGLYTEKKVEDGTDTRRQFACFDETTGFLDSTRILSDHAKASGNDVITVFEASDLGDVSVVKSFGGDKQATMPLIHNCGSAISETPWYQIQTDYFTPVEGTSVKFYAGGIPVSSKFWDRTTGSEMSFKTLDRWIDVFTGAVLRNIDSAGVTTSYTYEAKPVRLKSVRPAGGAISSYDYINATSSKNAHVVETISGNSGLHSTNTYEYDGLGRIRRVSKTLPAGNLAVVETKYDSFGRTFVVTQPVEYEEHPFHDIFHEGSLFLYDAFDRQKTITAADGASTTFDYTGVRVKTRTQTVATPEGDKNAVVTEVYDEEGQLESVTEQSGPGGAPVTTTHEYDITGSLVEVNTTSGNVTQTRKFEYDERGFLDREMHPETQDPLTPGDDYTDYSDYDARGHAWKRTLGGITTDYTFDAAERLTEVAGPSGPIKGFIFGNAGSTNGKLWKAIRHNELSSAGNADVTETYSYAANGQVNNRKTLVETVTYGANNARNATKIQEFDYNVTYDEHLLPRTITLPTCPGCNIEGGLGTVTNTRTVGYLTGVDGFAKLTYHPSGMVATVEHQTKDKPTDTYSVRNGLPRPSKITFTGCTSTKPFFLPGLVRAKVDPNACGIQVTWPAATLCGGASNIKYRVLRNGDDVTGPSCLTSTKFLDPTAVKGNTYVYTVVAEGPAANAGTGTCQHGETEKLVGGSFAFNSCDGDTLLTVEKVRASVGVPARFEAKLSSANGPIVEEELTFSVLGSVIGTARTGPTGVAAFDHLIDRAPGTYPNGVSVVYAGGLFPAEEATADLIVTCDAPSYSVKPVNLNVLAAGGPNTVVVNTSNLCTWGPEPAAGFLTGRVTPAGRQNGFDTFVIDVPSLEGSGERASFVKVDFDVSSKNVIVEQSSACTYSFSPTPAYIPFNNNLETSVNIIAPTGCAWTVTTDAPWLQMIRSSGNGNGFVTFRADQNSGKQRTAILSLNGGVEAGRVNQATPPSVVCPVMVEDLTNGGTVRDGQNVSLRVYVEGTYLNYKWYADGQKIRDCDDITCSALTIGPGFSGYPAPGQSTTFQVVVENSCDGVVSNSVTFTNLGESCRVPIISNSTFGTNDWPFDQNSPFPGAEVRIFARVDPHPYSLGDLTLQWYRGMAGDRSSKVADSDGGKTLEISVNPHHTTFYWLEATTPCGSQISRTAGVFSAPPPPRVRRRAVGKSFNSDAAADLPWQNTVTGQTEIWTMNGTNHTGTVPLQNSNPNMRLQSIGDIDDDERPDLIFRNPANGQNEAWLIGGSANFRRIEPLPVRPDGRWSIGAVADLDNDYNDDIVWHNNVTGENEIWFQQGTEHEGTWALPSNPGPGWGLHGTEDFNGDEKPDLFFHDRTTGQNAVWFMNDAERSSEIGTNSEGSGSSSSPVRRFTATVQAVTQMPNTNWMPALVADMNGDNKPDVVWRNGVTGENSVWLMQGTSVQSTVVMEERTDINWQIGGGGSTNAGTPGGTTDPRTATAISAVADPARVGTATAVTATLSAGSTPVAQRPLAFYLNGTEVSRLLTDATGSATAALNVSGLAAGTYPNAIIVRFDGDNSYNSSSATTNLVITAAPANVTWPNPAPIVYGTPLGAAQLNATADVPGTFVYSPAAGAILNAGFQTLSVTFTPSDPTVVPVTKSALLVVSKAASSVSWAAPAPIAYGTPLSDEQLRATSGLPGEFTYDPEPGTLLPVGNGQTLRVTFQPASANFDVSAATTPIDVTKGEHLIRWNDPAPMGLGDALSGAQLNATVITTGSAPAGAMTYDPPAGTVLPEGVHELKVTVAETAFYAAATATVDVIVTRSSALITWSNPAPIPYGTPLSATQLNATASVPGTFTYMPAAGSVLQAGTETLAVIFTPADSKYLVATAFVTIEVTKVTPGATWNAPAPIVYGTLLSATQLNATAGIVGEFEYTPQPGTVLDAGTYELTGNFIPGDVRNYNYVTLKVSLTVNMANQAITWPQPAPIVYGTALSATQLNATVSVAGPAPTGVVTYSPAAGTVLQAGNGQVLTVSVAATPNYNAAGATVTLDVLKATPVLTWPQPAPIVYPTLLSATQLNATANVPGSFTYAPAAGTLIEAGLHTLTADFTPADTRNYNDASTTTTLEVQKADPVLAWTAPAGIVYGTPLSATQLNAIADVAGTFDYTPPAGTILNAGDRQTLLAHFTPSDTRNYNDADASTTIDVARAPQTIVWSNPAPIVYGTPLSAVQLNSTVQVVGPSPAGAVTYAPPTETVLQAGAAQELTVSLAATANYNAATASVRIDVQKATPVIAWVQPAPIGYKTVLGAQQLNASANVAGTFQYTPALGTLLEAGTHPLTAHFTPSDTQNYNETSQTVTLEVQRANPVLAWARPAEIVYGTPLSSTQLNATADVPGAVHYTPAAGTILNAGNGQTLSAHFTPSDTRNYNEGDISTTIDVAKATQTIVWAAPAPIVYGTALSATQLNATVQVVGPAAHGALTYTPPAGTRLDAGAGQTLSVAVAETPNYLPASASVTLDVLRAPLSLVVDAKSKLYGASVPTLTGTLTGVMNNDPITPSYATTATMQSVTGTYPITATLVDPTNRLVNYDVTITPSTLTVHPAPLTIAANPASKQYSDPLPQLTLTFTGFVLGETPAVLTGVLSIQTTAERLSAPGTYPITIGGLTSTNYAITYIGSTFTVTQEDARVLITSPLFIGGARTGPTTVTLAATVRDISATDDAAGDVDAGDIRKATLTFIDRATNTTLCTATIGLLIGTDERTGIAACTFTRDFGATLPASLTAGARIGGYYTRDAATDDVVMTIATPTEDSITGGGGVVVASAAGALAPQTASTLRLNLNLQYDKNAVLKGKLTFSFWRTEGGVVRQYELTAAVGSMSIRRTTEGGTAALIGTGTLSDVTNPTVPVLVVDAAPLVVTATDAGEPSVNDAMSLTLFKRDGGLWLTTGWDGLRAAEQKVQQGNIQVHTKK